MQSNYNIKRPFINAVTMLLVSGLSLFLLIYVGFTEAQRTFQRFHIEKLAAQVRVIQNAMDTFLRAGLPIKQYVGFTTLVEPILASDDSIASMIAFDQSGRPIFSSGDDTIPLFPKDPANIGNAENSLELRGNDQYLQVVLPLRNKFERVGSLAVSMPRSIVTEHVEARFRSRLALAAGLSIIFALIISIGGPRLSRQQMPWLQIIYMLTFLVMAIVVIATLVSLYADGAQAKTKALADSLGQRMSDVVAFNLNINDFEGLDRTFGDYRRLNPDISAAGLIVDGKVQIHTDADMVGKPWVSDPHTYEYIFNLTGDENNRNIKVAVALPVEIVYRQVARSVKNFAALFVASAFLAGLFLQLGSSVQQSKSITERCSPEAYPTERDKVALNLVKPVFFVAVFLEHLNYSFLPQFMEQAAVASGLSTSFASMPFMVYYLCFALALIPAGHFSEQHGPRLLIYGGLMLTAGGLLSLALPLDFSMVTLARAASGIGQGMLFIGVQSYILAMASPDRITRGAAIIVFGFQGGMISGMAIGSLLVVYMGAEGVFTLASACAFAMAIYASLLLPPTARPVDAGARITSTLRRLGQDMARMIRSQDFLASMMLVGVPTKAVMTGVIIFALPLLLTRMGYAQEDIGQIIMLYAAGVLLASTVVSRRVDRTGETGIVLFWGAAISGIGLMVIGLADWEALGGRSYGSASVTLTLITGVIVVGFAHGFINAPVVTHIADSKLATKIGVCRATATYRFLERIGHIVGPIIVGQLLILGGQKIIVVAWVGGAVLLFGFLYLVFTVPTQTNLTRSEHMP